MDVNDEIKETFYDFVGRKVKTRDGHHVGILSGIDDGPQPFYILETDKGLVHVDCIKPLFLCADVD